MTFVHLRGDMEPHIALERLRDQVNRLFEDSYGRGATAGAGGDAPWAPPVNLEETPDEIVVWVPLAGIDPDGLTVFVEGGLLHIGGERKPPEIQGTPVRAERLSGAFRREVEIPVPVDSGKVEAAYRNGILRIVLPKAAEAKPRRIQVRSE